MATGALFGAVSGSTLAAVLQALDSANIKYEARTAALYPFMDIKESLQSSAVTALLLGVALGILTRPEPVYESFFNLLFRGFLSVLMIIMGMEATQRMNELRKVAQWFAIYAFFAPIVHGFLAFGLGLVIHKLTGFSIGGPGSLCQSLGLYRCLHGYRHPSGHRPQRALQGRAERVAHSGQRED